MIREVDSRAIRAASDVLEYSGIVAIPTETVYGLGANADDEIAVKKIFAAKGRPQNRPLSVLITGEEALDAWASNIPQSAYTLARHFWPGPLTLILPKGNRVGSWITGGQDTIGLRSPAHPWALALLRQFAGKHHRGIAAPSANTFGQISPTSAQHVIDDLGQKPRGKVDLILDGGDCPVGLESTIIDLTQTPPVILRQGAISKARLEAVLGTSVSERVPENALSSGSSKQHYAPKTAVTLVETVEDALTWSTKKRIAVMAQTPCPIPTTQKIAAWTVCEENPNDYARHLYARLHDLDALSTDMIVIVRPTMNDEWTAVADRLRRVAG